MELMKLESLYQFTKENDQLKFPITIPLRKSDEERWCSLRDRLKKINKKLGILDFARPAIVELMDQIEVLIEEEEKKLSDRVSSVSTGTNIIPLLK